jgi:hypothetical protein
MFSEQYLILKKPASPGFLISSASRAAEKLVRAGFVFGI